MEEVKSLLTHKKVVNHIDRLDEHFMAPLHIAARFDQDDIVKILVGKGAGRLSLVIICIPVFLSLCLSLSLSVCLSLSLSPSLSLPLRFSLDEHSMMILHIAARYGWHEIVKTLMGKGQVGFNHFALAILKLGGLMLNSPVSVHVETKSAPATSAFLVVICSDDDEHFLALLEITIRFDQYEIIKPLVEKRADRSISFYVCLSV